MQSEMAVMGTEGDTKIIWDSGRVEEVDNARRTFDDLVKKKKYAAFEVTKKGEKDGQVFDFDPEAEKLILVPPMKGG